MTDKALVLSRAELHDIIESAAEGGAKRALHAVGLHDEEAAADVRDLRGLIDAWRQVKSTALKTAVGWATKLLLTVLLAGVGFALWARN